MQPDRTAGRLPDEVREAAVEAAATATEQHHIEFGETDAMGNNPCVCGTWWDSDSMPGWDEHMAEVGIAAAAPLLIEAGRRAALDGARTEYGVQSGDIVFGATDAATALHRAANVEFWTAVQRQVVETEWQTVAAGETTPP